MKVYGGILLWCVLCVAAGVAYGAEEKTGPGIQALKPLCLKTPIVEGGEGRAIIVSSKRPQDVRLAESIAAGVRRATGAELPIKSDAEITDKDCAATHVIVLGNLMTNKLVERLYCRWYVRTDAWFPGKGGYEVRTVHDPWGTGKNVILLGGSDDEGVSAAVGEFLKMLRPGKDVALDRLITVKTSADLDHEPFKEKLDGQRMDSLLSGVKSLTLRGLMSRAGACAFNYYAAGNDQWARLFKACVLEHKARGELGDDTHMDLWYALIGMDLVEESPALTDEDRRELTGYLLFLCRSEEGANKRWFLKDIQRNTIRHNHVMLAGLDAFFGGEYFKKYYRLEEVDVWLANAALCFKGQERHSKTQCDANGYEGLAVSLAMVYALAKPDRTFFDSGAGRKAAERLVRCLDNTLCQAAYGDSWDAFGFPGPVARMANWVCRDPRYQFLIEERHRLWKGARWGNNPGFFVSDPAAKPKDLDGVQAIAVDPEFYGYSTRNWKAVVPLERSFDKIVFRERLDPSAQYLLLDGLNMGSHGHMDVNTIVEFADRGRMFLVDMSYTDGVEQKYHNGVTAIKDGFSSATPAGAELVTCADVGATGFSRTVLHEHSGTDWARNIFWRKGKYFLVLDDLKPREDGDFNFQCRWRTIGAARLEGEVLTVEQVASGPVEFVSEPGVEGRKVACFRTKEAALELDVRLPSGKCALAVFGKGKDSGSDSVWIDIGGKRIEQSFNLPTKEIGPSSAKWDLSEPTPNISVGESGLHRFLITLREGPMVLLDRLEFVAAGGKKTTAYAADGRVPGGLPTEQHDLFVLKNAGGVECELADAGPGFAHYWKQYPYAEAKVNVLRQKAAARLAAGQSYVFTNLFYTKAAEAADEYGVTWAGGDCALITGKEPAVAGLAADGLSVGPLKMKAEGFHLRRDGFSLVNATEFELGQHMMRAVKPVSLDVDLAAGKMTAQADEDCGFESPLVGEPLTKGAQEVALKAVPERWRARYAESFAVLVDVMKKSAPEPRASRVEPPVGEALSAAWKSTGAGRVNCMGAADVDGDGKVETVVGAEGVRLLDGAGGRRWEYATGGPVNAVCVCDLDGDGRLEIVAGCQDANVHVVDAAGSVKWTFTCPPRDASVPYAHYGSKGAVRAVWAGALEKGGRPVAVVGPEDGYTFCLSAEGKPLWKYRSGEALTSMAAADLDGDGNCEVLGGSADSSWSRVSAINTAGKGRTFNNLGGWGTSLISMAVGDADGDGRPEVVAGTSRNKVYFMDSKGQAKWTFALGDAPTCLALADLDGDGKLEVLAGSPSYYVYALSREGSLIWNLGLGAEVTALCAGKAGVVAGTRSGKLYRVSRDGRVAGTLTTESAVTRVEQSGDGVVYGTEAGEVGQF